MFGFHASKEGRTTYLISHGYKLIDKREAYLLTNIQKVD